MKVRHATLDDAEAVASVHVRSWQDAYAGIIPDDYLAALDPVARAGTHRGWIADPPPGTVILVAEDPVAGVVGFVNAGRDREDDADGEIRAIYVTPEHLGRGVGRALMEAALRELSAQGHRVVRLWVLSANQRARRFYERAGFVLDGATSVFRVERGGDPPVDLDEVRYVLDGRLG